VGDGTQDWHRNVAPPSFVEKRLPIHGGKALDESLGTGILVDSWRKSEGI